MIGLIIFMSFSLTAAINFFNYSKVIMDDIENISKLTSTNIYSTINNELTKPIFVSLTMANDSFLKDWLIEEKIRPNYSEHQKDLIEYLKGLKIKYDYNSVFMISEFSKIYYHYNGINKVISKDDDHDIWYYNFVDKRNSYLLDVDLDEVDNNVMTVFVNCRVENDDRELLGVTGVGVKMQQIQEILKAFEDNYDLEAYLVNSEGLVQVHTDRSKIENYNIFDDEYASTNRDHIISSKYSMNVFRINDSTYNGFLITRYIDELDWYIIIKKDTSELESAFKSQIMVDFIVMFVLTIIMILLSNNLIENHDNQIRKLSKYDQLSGLLNRRGFDEELSNTINNLNEDSRSKYAIIFDIDRFKQINDNYGHNFGDKVIQSVANISRDKIENFGILARWGGDEFVAILDGKEEFVITLVEELINDVRNDKDLMSYGITISVGITKLRTVDTTELVIGRVDNGMYTAKRDGRSKYVMIN